MIATRRLSAQHIARPLAKDGPAGVVYALGAMQAHDLTSAKWAVGLRLGEGATEADVDRALADASIVRIHGMRGTWHFIVPDDLRCEMKLVGPAAVAALAGSWRRLELDEATFARSSAVITEALGPKDAHLTRAELGEALERAGISTAGERLDAMLQRAGLDSLIGSGVPRGGEHTFALLDHRVPRLDMPGEKTICAVLMQRYFKSRSPATMEDYAWWAGLDESFVRPIFESMKRELESEEIEGRTWWSDRRAAAGPMSGAALLPAGDEFLVGYRDRSHAVDPARAAAAAGGEGWAEPLVVAGGRVLGTWRAERSGRSVTITPSWWTRPDDAELEAVAAAARRYGAFFGLEAALAA